MKLRNIIFWLHLTAGIVAGTVILAMSVTGVLLAFERQIIAFDIRIVNPPAVGTPRVSLDTVVAIAGETVLEGTPSAVTLAVDPTAAAMINFGRQQTVFVDSYTGAVRGSGATATRRFFHAVTDWHRWLGTHGDSRAVGRSVTGACNAAFMVLVIYAPGYDRCTPGRPADWSARSSQRGQGENSTSITGTCAREKLAISS